MITKKEVMESIQSMPEEEFSLDILLERLILLNKIKKGIDDMEMGRHYTIEEIRKELGI